PSNHTVVLVVRSLAEAMGVPQPLVFVNDEADDTVDAHVTPAPCLVLGRRAASSPADPYVRDAIGRALLRLSTGGDALHRYATPEQVVALLVALAIATGVDVDVEQDFDWQFAATIREGLPSPDTLTDLTETALAFRDSVDGLS